MNYIQNVTENLNPSISTMNLSVINLRGLRFLAGSNDLAIDYTVFAMVLLTMVFLLVVGAIRHKIDTITKGNDFFEKVMEACYHELSTLGIVEACVFLLHKYYEGFVITTEQVFAEVHFTLFFVVIINAIMSTLQFLVSTRVAHKDWVLMEAIDLDHYVAVRKQFESVNKDLKELMMNYSSSAESKGKLLHRFWKSTVTKMMLHRKRNELLTQVRFHDMRVHFIESHKLPHNFRLSDYLKLCLTDEFKNLVHVSSLSWYTLIFVVNLIYYLMGMIYAKTNSDKIIGTTLSVTYLGYSLAFVVVSYIVSIKMKQIFFKIVKDDTWIQEITQREMDSDRNTDRLRSLIRSASSIHLQTIDRTNQYDYFWGSNPSLVVTIAQLGQFGYAMSFAIFLVFNKTISVEKETWYGWFALTPLVCYVLFLTLWSFIMPKYTQCTSLGKLVRKSHLIDIDSRSKLQRAKSKRQEDIDYYLTAEKEVSKNMKRRTQRKRQDSSQSNILSKLFPIKKEKLNDDDESDNENNHGSLSGSQRLLEISELVKRPTADLPDEKIITRRRQRKLAKSLSDGVAAMRLFSTTSTLAEEALRSDADAVVSKGKLESLGEKLPKTRRPRKKMLSTGVFLMQSEKPDPSDNLDYETHSHGFDSQSEVVKSWTSSANPRNDVNIMKKEVTKLQFSEKKRSGLPMVQETSKDYQISLVDEDEDLSIASSVHSEESFERRVDIHDDIVTTEIVPLHEKLCEFILHYRYPWYSAVFGTMIVFFLLSLRVEIILIDTCAMKDNMNTWNYIPDRVTAFWLTVAWLSLFIFESSMISFLLCKNRNKFNLERVIAAVSDFLLTFICVVLFVWAETQRCCECPESSPFIKATTAGNNECIVPSQSECCPSFGSRLCGGIGNIEPFVSLIALRIFRFEFAKVLVSFYRDVIRKVFKKSRCEESSTDQLREIDGISRNESGSSIDFEVRAGTIGELWILAIAEYPDIVKEHGIFSGLLLESMLGIQRLPYDEKNAVTTSQNDGTKPLSGLDGLNPNGHRDFQRAISALSLRSAAGGSTISNLDNNNFLRPAAALVRSMRRCECKWKWLKAPGEQPWEMVDVVLTEFELVWFDATGNPIFWDEAEQKRIETVKDSMVTLKGGKGLHLSDVATGREVLGRLALSDIDHIQVHRIFPSGEMHTDTPTSVPFLDIEETLSSDIRVSKEYWKDNDETCYLELPLQKQWDNIIEDRLRLHSSQGTLYLRFLVDLYDLVQAKVSTDEIEKKQGALLWCESISHLCGKTQLKQKLPHFGEDRNHELQDFIEIKSRANEIDNERSTWNRNLLSKSIVGNLLSKTNK